MGAPKEIAILDLKNDSTPVVALFKSPDRHPVARRSINEMAMKYTGLPYESGDIPYEDISRFIRRNLCGTSHVYTRHDVDIKERWFHYSFPAIFHNIEFPENLDYSSAPQCNHHTSYPRSDCCSVRNVVALKSWLMQQPNFNSYISKPLR